MTSIQTYKMAKSNIAFWSTMFKYTIISWITILLILDNVAIVTSDESDSSDCDEDFWTTMDSGFDGLVYQPNTVEYDNLLSVLGVAPVAGKRKKRQTAPVWCQGGYYLWHAPDGDSCCQSIRASCMWYSPVPDPAAIPGGDDSGQLFFPIWKATVHATGAITVRYQYFFDVKCNSIENIYPNMPSMCISCAPIQHERKVLLASAPPTFINPLVPGNYGHAGLMVGQTIFTRYIETLYCACIT